jgi:hypothetical protein
MLLSMEKMYEPAKTEMFWQVSKIPHDVCNAKQCNVMQGNAMQCMHVYIYIFIFIYVYIVLFYICISSNTTHFKSAGYLAV